MEATVTEIYNHSESYTNANQYTARNTALYNLFTHLVANPPTGWTVISSSIPAPSSAAWQEYNAVIEGQAFRMKLYTYTSSTSNRHRVLLVDIQNTGGTNILSGTDLTCYFGAVSGSYQYDFNLTMTSYVTANKLYAIIFSSTQATGTRRTVAKIYTEEKATGAEDFLIASDFLTTYRYLGAMTAATTRYILLPYDGVSNADGQYAVIPGYATIGGGIYYAKLINTFAHVNSGVLTFGSIYSDGTDSYLRFGNCFTALIKL